MEKERLLKIINARLLCMDYSELVKVFKFIRKL